MLRSWAFNPGACPIISTLVDGAVLDMALKRWISEGEKSASDLIDKNWSIIEDLATTLLDKEIIYAEELDEILSR